MQLNGKYVLTILITEVSSNLNQCKKNSSLYKQLYQYSQLPPYDVGMREHVCKMRSKVTGLLLPCYLQVMLLNENYNLKTPVAGSSAGNLQIHSIRGVVHIDMLIMDHLYLNNPFKSLVMHYICFHLFILLLRVDGEAVRWVSRGRRMLI